MAGLGKCNGSCDTLDGSSDRWSKWNNIQI